MAGGNGMMSKSRLCVARQVLMFFDAISIVYGSVGLPNVEGKTVVAGDFVDDVRDKVRNRGGLCFR